MTPSDWLGRKTSTQTKTKNHLSRNVSKHTFWHVPNKDSDHILAIWSESSLSTWRLCILGYPKCDHWEFWSHCADGQTDLNLYWVHMSKGTLIWIFTGCTCPKVRFLRLWLIYSGLSYQIVTICFVSLQERLVKFTQELCWVKMIRRWQTRKYLSKLLLVNTAVFNP